MKKRKSFGIAILAATLLIGGTAPWSVEEVRAESVVSEERSGSVLNAIAVTISGNDQVTVDFSKVAKEMQNLWIKIGTGNFEKVSNKEFSEEHILSYTKMQIGGAIVLKKDGGSEERRITFAEQTTPEETSIKKSADMKNVYFSEDGYEYQLEGWTSWYPVENRTVSPWQEGDKEKGKARAELKVRRAKEENGSLYKFASPVLRYSVDRTEVLRENLKKVVFEADGENSGYLRNVDFEMEYSLEGGGSTYKNIEKRTNDPAGSFLIPGEIRTSQGIKVRYPNSFIEPIEIKVIERRFRNGGSEIEYKEGYFVGIEEGTQVKNDENGIWKDIVGDTYKVVKTGKYIFRMAPRGNGLATTKSGYYIKTITALNFFKHPEENGNAGGGNRNAGGANNGNAGGGAIGGFGGGNAGGGAIGGFGGGNAGGGAFGGFGGGGFAGGAVAVQPEGKKEVKAEEAASVEKTQNEKSADKKMQETKEIQNHKKGQVSKNGKSLRTSVAINDLENRAEGVITVSAGEKSFVLKTTQEDLIPGKTLKVFEKKNGKLILTNGKKYRVGEEGLALSLKEGKIYVTMSEAQAKKVEKKIFSSLKLSTKRFSNKNGIGGKISFIKGFNKENIRKVEYKYDKAKLSVTKNGVFKVKTAGNTEVLIVKVTLKNGMTKSMQLKVS